MLKHFIQVYYYAETKPQNASLLLQNVDEKSWQIDLDLLEKFLKNKTRQINDKCIFQEDGKIIKAIVAVHVLGNMCDMNRLVKICDECNYGSYQGRCVICGGPGIADAYYCKECTLQEKDRDGCPKIVNLGSARTDLFYERKKYGFKNRS